MPTYNPPSVPFRSKSASPFALALYHLRKAYFTYSVTFALYVMDPIEKLVFNSFILLIFGLLAYYLFPLAVSTLGSAVIRFICVPKLDPNRVEDIIDGVRLRGAATLEPHACLETGTLHQLYYHQCEACLD